MPGDVPDCTHFNVIVTKRHIAKCRLGLIIGRLPANSLYGLVGKLNNGLPVEAFLIVASVNRQQEHGSAAAAVIAGSQVRGGASGIEYIPRCAKHSPRGSGMAAKAAREFQNAM